MPKTIEQKTDDELLLAIEVAETYAMIDGGDTEEEAIELAAYLESLTNELYFRQFARYQYG